MVKQYRSSILLAVALLLFVCGVQAQTATGTVTGVITDTGHAVIPGARVTLTNRGTAATREAVTGRSGDFRIDAVPQGQYQLVAQANGFKVGAVDFKLDVAGAQTLNIVLPIGSHTETVQVNGAIQRVDTENSTLSNVVNVRQVVDLPLNGRDVFVLESLVPGVTVGASANLNNNVPYSSGVNGILPSGGANTFVFNTAGHPSGSNDYTLDGVANNDPNYAGHPGITPSVDSVQEFRMLETNFSAEYGRNSGAVVNVATKSGTNVFHGTAYAFVRNNIFDARTYFDPAKIAPLRRRSTFG